MEKNRARAAELNRVFAMGTRVFVGGLKDPRVRERDLEDFFRGESVLVHRLKLFSSVSVYNRFHLPMNIKIIREWDRESGTVRRTRGNCPFPIVYFPRISPRI